MAQVTVLMPVFNAERFLEAAIDSILSQTFTDFEFIIIDDASTDASASIIMSYSDDRIRFYQNEKNLGITSTLNKGIQLASTGLIARMDADDISYPERIKKQFDYMQQHPDCALVSSSVCVITEAGEFVRKDNVKSEHYFYSLTFFSWIYHPTVLYRKNAVESIGMYTTDYAEDFELFWQLSRQYKMHNLDEVLLDYRISNQSLHQVLHKAANERAHQEQMLRNIRYYTGQAYSIPISYLECYRHNFSPLLHSGKISSMIACIKELDFITSCILAKPDHINYNAQAIRKAALYKRRYILSNLARGLPFYKKQLLWLRVESPGSMLRYVRRKLLLTLADIFDFKNMPAEKIRVE